MKQKSTLKKITGSREFLLAVILILLFAIITAISPSFLKPKSLMDMLKNNAVTMVMALGMLCVMLVGGIDISIMSTLALSGMSIGMLLKYGQITSTILAFCNRACHWTCLRFPGRSGDFQSQCTADHCNHGIYVCVPCLGISGI